MSALSSPAYQAGFVDGALSSPPTPEHYEESPEAFYYYLRGHKDASDELREGLHDPALTAAGYGWMENGEAHRLARARERLKELSTSPPGELSPLTNRRRRTLRG